MNSIAFDTPTKPILNFSISHIPLRWSGRLQTHACYRHTAPLERKMEMKSPARIFFKRPLQIPLIWYSKR